MTEPNTLSVWGKKLEGAWDSSMYYMYTLKIITKTKVDHQKKN
jgi:hypothetical protein